MPIGGRHYLAGAMDPARLQRVATTRGSRALAAWLAAADLLVSLASLHPVSMTQIGYDSRRCSIDMRPASGQFVLRAFFRILQALVIPLRQRHGLRCDGCRQGCITACSHTLIPNKSMI
ncbi:MAG: hypothetical protein KIS79_10755 [Burkholderiales bacterium]|nr:hypothetical protein [Burkholderiales bacterium]